MHRILRVRETGSLNDALKGIPADLEEVQAIRKEADEFGKKRRRLPGCLSGYPPACHAQRDCCLAILVGRTELFR